MPRTTSYPHNEYSSPLNFYLLIINSNIMTYKQALKIAMFLRITLFFKKNKTLLDTFTFLAGIIDKFQDAYSRLEPILEQQAANTTGLTKTKEQALADVVNALLPLCRKAYAWARINKNETLKSLFNIHVTDFSMSSPGQDDYTLVSNLIAGLNTNITDLLEVRITKIQLDEATALSIIFKSTLGVPQKAKKDTTAATVSLDEEMLELTDLEEICHDLVVNEYNITDHDMVLTYVASRKIGNTTKTHTTVSFNVFADAAKLIPIKDAAVTIVERNRTEHTDYLGMGEIVQFKGGKLTLLIKAEKLLDKEVPFQVKNGQHTDLEVVMS